MPRGDKSNLNRDEVIIALTDGVGATFGRASRRAFYEQLKRLESERGFENAEFEERQFLVDLLAIASFYQCVIVQIESARSFLGVLRRAGATHLRVAGDKLNWRYANRAHAATLGFSRIIRVAVRECERPLLRASKNADRTCSTARHRAPWIGYLSTS